MIIDIREIDTTLPRWSHFAGKDENFIRRILRLADYCESCSRSALETRFIVPGDSDRIQALCAEIEEYSNELDEWIRKNNLKVSY